MGERTFVNEELLELVGAVRLGLEGTIVEGLGGSGARDGGG